MAIPCRICLAEQQTSDGTALLLLGKGEKSEHSGKGSERSQKKGGKSTSLNEKMLAKHKKGKGHWKSGLGHNSVLFLSSPVTTKMRGGKI